MGHAQVETVTAVEKQRTVLITCAAQNAGLASIRSLHAAGWRVVAVDSDRRAKGLVGKGCDVPLVAPAAPGNDPAGYASFIFKTLRNENVDVLLPVTDEAIFALLPYREEIEKIVAVPWPSTDSLRAAADKQATFALAETIGLVVPQMTQIPAPRPAAELADLTFPLVVKPHRSLIAGRKVAVTYADDAEELAKILDDLPDGAFPVLLQQRIVGPGEGYFGVYEHGRPVVESAHRRLREMPPSGGVSTLREAIEVPDDLRAMSRKLLAAWQWHGPAMVEFKRGPDGRPYLMEVNGRLWGSLQLSVDAGIDVPLASVLVAAGLAVPPMTYQPGVKTRWLLGDADALLTRLLKRDAAQNLPPDALSRRRWLTEFVADFFRPAVHLEVLRLRDFAPFDREFTNWAGNKWRLVRRRLVRSIDSVPALLHVHSNFSYDGEMSVAELAAMARDNGFGVLCLADHTRGLTPDRARRMVAECEANSRDDLLIVPGFEFDQRDEHHILGLGMTQLVAEDNYGALITEIRAQGGFSVLAHPKPGDLTRHPELTYTVDGIEIWNTVHDGQYLPNPAAAAEFHHAQQHGGVAVPLAASDFHHRGNLKSLALHLHLRPGGLDWPAVRDALRNGRFHLANRWYRVPSTGLGTAGIAAVRFLRRAQNVVAQAKARWRARRSVPYWEYLGCDAQDAGPTRDEPDVAAICWRVIGTFAGEDRRGPCCAHLPDCRDCDYYRFVNGTWTGRPPLRVLHLIETVNPGGAEQMIIDLVAGLRGKNVTSHVLLIKHGWLEDRLREMHVPVTVRPLRGSRDWRWIADLIRIVRRRRYDLLHSHEFTMNGYTFLAGRFGHAPTLATVHGNIEYVKARWRRRGIYTWLARQAKPMVAVSGDTRRRLVADLGLPADGVRVIHNGVSLDDKTPDRDWFRREYGLAPGAKLIGVIGRLTTVKGADVLIDALPHLAREYPDFHVAFLGRGELLAQLTAQVAKLGLADRVTFLGHVDNVRQRLGAFDLIVIPSRHEGLSLTLIEAMAASLPIVATAVGGTPEALEDQVSGLLVPPEDPAALAEACARLLRDPERAARLGARARERVMRDFTLDRMVSAYLSLYTEKTGRKP